MLSWVNSFSRIDMIKVERHLKVTGGADEWTFSWESTDLEATVRLDGTFVGFMSLEVLAELVEFKKAIDDLT